MLVMYNVRAMVVLLIQVARELEEQALDGAGLRQLLALKNRELRHLRKLSQYILEQRNEVRRVFRLSFPVMLGRF